MRTKTEVDRALELLRMGFSPTEAGRLTGIPRSTIRDWGYGRIPERSRFDPRCPGCNPSRDLSRPEPTRYAYLLGMYLGDGCISTHKKGVYKLRITLDSAYPGIISECARAIEAVVAGKTAHVLQRTDERCVEVSAYWKHWPCVFPQHGPGPKHMRPIVLADWQTAIVAANCEPFVRGLIHSDGCRIIATERKGGWTRRAPRYAFSNRSEDILQLFGAACNALGVHFTRASKKQIAIYSRNAVERLDEFVGPKS